MKVSSGLVLGMLLVMGMTLFASGCVVTPRGPYAEGYYDNEHHRWWHENGWVDCGPQDNHCR
jgi:hypothetical protein